MTGRIGCSILDSICCYQQPSHVSFYAGDAGSRARATAKLWENNARAGVSLTLSCHVGSSQTIL